MCGSYFRCLLILVFLTIASLAEDCANKFCPIGTFCEARFVVKCSRPPCRPIFACLPVSENGCAAMKCSEGLVCVEKTLPCVSHSCKKFGICAKPGTCDAQECPPSHNCEVVNAKPTCVRGIFTLSDVIAQLPQRPLNTTQ